MASYTTNLNLKKPATGDNVLVGDLNGNFDAIDKAAGLPVGSLYFRLDDDNGQFDPATALGYGTWVRLNDAFIVAAGTNYPLGSSGQTSMHVHQNKDEPNVPQSVKDAGLIRSDTASSVTTSNSSNHTHTASLGGSQFGGRILVAEEGFSGNLEPPYQAVAVWYRVS